MRRRNSSGAISTIVIEVNLDCTNCGFDLLSYCTQRFALALGGYKIDLASIDISEHFTSEADTVVAVEYEGDLSVDTTPVLDRWTIDPQTRTTKVDNIDERLHEFPRHNPKVGGSKHRFGYTAGATTGKADLFGANYKIDYDAGTIIEHDHGEGRGGAEPIFVPKEGGTAEDDGWLMVAVHDATVDRSDLVILDAADFGGDEVARIELPRRVPHGFHGNWVRD
jgi:carotenoid cleavage dioxygenase-like enzyme